MRKTIERIPLPLAGPMLGFAAMGGVIENYSETAKLICVAISVCLLVLLLFKIGTCLDMVKEIKGIKLLGVGNISDAINLL